jgi:hypothetical protein
MDANDELLHILLKFAVNTGSPGVEMSAGTLMRAFNHKLSLPKVEELCATLISDGSVADVSSDGKVVIRLTFESIARAKQEIYLKEHLPFHRKRTSTAPAPKVPIKSIAMTEGQYIHKLLQYMKNSRGRGSSWTPEELVDLFQGELSTDEIQVLLETLVKESDGLSASSADGFAFTFNDASVHALIKQNYLKDPRFAGQFGSSLFDPDLQGVVERERPGEKQETRTTNITQHFHAPVHGAAGNVEGKQETIVKAGSEANRPWYIEYLWQIIVGVMVAVILSVLGLN